MMAAYADEAAPTHLEVAAPFLLTGLVVLVGAALSTVVVARARLEYARILDEAGVPDSMRIVSLRPESLADMGNWLMDGAGMFGAVTGPLIGVSLLYERFSETVIVLYSAVILLNVAGFALFVTQVSPRGYPNRPFGWHVGGHVVGPRSAWIFTPMVLLAAFINFSAGVVVYIAGP